MLTLPSIFLIYGRKRLKIVILTSVISVKHKQVKYKRKTFCIFCNNGLAKETKQLIDMCFPYAWLFFQYKFFK